LVEERRWRELGFFSCNNSADRSRVDREAKSPTRQGQQVRRFRPAVQVRDVAERALSGARLKEGGPIRQVLTCA